MPVDLLAVLAVMLIALSAGLWRTRHQPAAARVEPQR
jgi:hypothetical protein